MVETLFEKRGKIMSDDPLKFDDWGALAKSDPEAFEQRRKEVIEQFIAGLPPNRQQRLRRLQWRVDMERQRCANPMQSCLRLYSMMWNSVYGKQGLQETLLHGMPDTGATTGSESADILSFRRVSNPD
jgi:hypothetical protein